MSKRDRSPAGRVLAVCLGLLVAGACGTRLDDALIEGAAHGEPSGRAVEEGAARDHDPATAPAREDQDTPLAATGRQPAAAPDGLSEGAETAAGAGPGGGGAPAPGAAQAVRADPRPASGGDPGAPGASPAAAGSTGPAPGPGAEEAVPEVAPAPAPGRAGRSPVVIGSIGDYSGVVGAVLRSGGPIAKVVERYINDHGGLNGHPVRVIVGDAGGDPTRALSLVRSMVEEHGAVAFMGNFWPLSGGGPRVYLEDKGVPVIGGDAASAAWVESPMYFPSGTAWPSITVGAAKAAVTAGKGKIALLYCVEAEACRTWHDSGVAGAGSVGAEIVYRAQISLAQPDFTAECLQAQRNGAQTIMAGMESASISRLARACLQQGYRPLFITGSLAAVASTANDPNLDGLLVPVQNFPYMTTDLPGARTYRTAVQRYAPTLEEGPITSAGWTAGVLLHHAGRHLPDVPVSAHLLTGLYQIKDDTLGGLAPPLTFSEGRPAVAPRCFFLMRVEGSQFTAPNGSQQDCI